MRCDLLFLFAAVGCSGSPLTTDATTTDAPGPVDTEPSGYVPDNPGACGDTLFHTVTLRGLVENSDGSPAVGAGVRLEERNFESFVQVWGEGTTTDANGFFEFVAVDIIEVERCWGRIVDYALVAALNGSTAEDNSINTSLRTAVTYGYDVDLSAFPLVLSP